MTPAIKTTMGGREWGMLVLLSVLWGGSFFFIAVAVAELPPLTIVLLRVALAAVTLHLLRLLMGLRLPRDGASWRAFVAMGVINNVVPFTLIVWGQSHIASALASILNATTPLFTVVVAHYLTRDERLSPARLSGVAIGLAGVVAMLGPTALAELGTALAAELACLAAALSYAFGGVYGRRFRGLGLDPLVVATGQVTTSAVMLLPIALLVDQPWTLPVPSLAAMAAVAALAVVSTGIAYVLYFRLLAAVGATNVLLVTLLIPVSAILLGVTILGEQLASRHLLGMALIGLGLSAIDGRLWRWSAARRLRLSSTEER